MGRAEDNPEEARLPDPDWLAQPPLHSKFDFSTRGALQPCPALGPALGGSPGACRAGASRRPAAGVRCIAVDAHTSVPLPPLDSQRPPPAAGTATAAAGGGGKEAEGGEEEEEGEEEDEAGPASQRPQRRASRAAGGKKRLRYNEDSDGDEGEDDEEGEWPAAMGWLRAQACAGFAAAAATAGNVLAARCPTLAAAAAPSPAPPSAARPQTTLKPRSARHASCSGWAASSSARRARRRPSSSQSRTLCELMVGSPALAGRAKAATARSPLCRRRRRRALQQAACSLPLCRPAPAPAATWWATAAAAARTASRWRCGRASRRAHWMHL